MNRDPSYFDWYTTNGELTREGARNMRDYEIKNDLPPARQQPDETWSSWEHRSNLR